MQHTGESPLHSRRIIEWGIAGFLVLLGVAIVLLVVLRAPSTGPPTAYYFPFDLGWIWGIFWIFIIFWIVRWFVWPWGGWYSRRYRRRGDQAYYVLRERYAKGEITKEQFQQMMRDLEHPFMSDQMHRGR